MLAVIVIDVPSHLKPEAIALNANFPGLDLGPADAHILLASVAIVTMCLNIWPWLRVRHPTGQRWSGRVWMLYSFAMATSVV